MVAEKGRDVPRGMWSSLASPSPAAGPERHLLAAEPALCLEEHAFLNETRAVGRSQASWPDPTVRALVANNAAHLLTGTRWLQPRKECSRFTGITRSHSCSSKNIQTSSVCGKEGTLARVTRCRPLSQASLSNAFLPHVDGERAGLQAFLLVESGWGCRTPLLPFGQGPRLCRAGDTEP